MKKFLLSLICLGTAFMAEAQNSELKTNLEKHLYYLASDSLKGRKAGTADAAKARAYILEQWQQIGLTPFFSDGFEDRFDGYCNLVGLIEGTDELLKNEYILIGAHFDHLGVKNEQIYNGADDNASGSTALLELARLLKQDSQKLKRSVIIAAFDAEESGLLGSNHLAERMEAEGMIDKVSCMMSVDMVGWYGTSGVLKITGAGTIQDGENLLLSVADGLNLKISDFETSVFTATDTRGFAVKGIPTLCITTGLKSPYHKPADDADLIDYDGLEQITGYLGRLTLEMAGNPDVEPSGKVAKIHSGESQKFEVFVGGGMSYGTLQFPDSYMTTTGKLGYNAGITAQYNAGKFGFRVGASYEKTSSRFPDATNLYGGNLALKQSAVSVPVTILLQTKDPSARFYFGIGADYRYILDSSTITEGGVDFEANQNQWGYHFLFGFKIGKFYIEDSFESQANGLFCGDGAPKAGINVTSMKLGYIF